MICERISPEKYPWNQRVTRPEISCTKQTLHLVFKLEIFSQVLDTSSLGIKPTRCAAWFLGSPREAATNGASKDRPSPTPGNQDWETAPTFPRLREPASTEPEAVGTLYRTHHVGSTGRSDSIRWLPVLLAAEKPGIPEPLIQSDDTTSVCCGREMGSNSHEW